MVCGVCDAVFRVRFVDVVIACDFVARHRPWAATLRPAGMRVNRVRVRVGVFPLDASSR